MSLTRDFFPQSSLYGLKYRLEKYYLKVFTCYHSLRLHEIEIVSVYHKRNRITNKIRTHGTFDLLYAIERVLKSMLPDSKENVSLQVHTSQKLPDTTSFNGVNEYEKKKIKYCSEHQEKHYHISNYCLMQKPRDSIHY